MEMLYITRLPIICCKWQFIIQLHAVLINIEIIIINICYENKEMIQKDVPQSAKISKLEWISSKFPSQLKFGGERISWGTARKVLFVKRYVGDYFKNRKGRAPKKSRDLSNIANECYVKFLQILQLHAALIQHNVNVTSCFLRRLVKSSEFEWMCYGVQYLVSVTS